MPIIVCPTRRMTQGELEIYLDKAADILRCANGSFYTGITTDVARRVEEHNGYGGHDKLGARYTRSRRPVSLAYVEEAASRDEATKREAAIRRLGRAGKAVLYDRGRG